MGVQFKQTDKMLLITFVKPSTSTHNRYEQSYGRRWSKRLFVIIAITTLVINAVPNKLT